MEIVINGNTGWQNPGSTISGEAAIKNLRDLLSIDYHARRQNYADGGTDPDTVELHLVDTLNDAHYLCLSAAIPATAQQGQPVAVQVQRAPAGARPTGLGINSINSCGSLTALVRY